jgi:hypothetical protein
MTTASIKKSEIEDTLRNLLEDEGYKLNKKTGLEKLGSDIKASMDDKDWYIEIIQNQESGVERIQNFFQAFFQALSRLNNKGCKHIVIAMPQNMRKILPVRAKIYKVAWKRIAEAFPELEIWLVDTETKKYQKTSWIYWLKQKKS